jgi:heme-degrading monooxygenase HmoA
MIIRIVKMTFKEANIKDFLQMFGEKQTAIASADGCLHLELWNDKSDKCVFFTYSHWKNESFLNKYRDSDLFAVVWPMTKEWFETRAEAWTVEQVQV